MKKKNQFANPKNPLITNRSITSSVILGGLPLIVSRPSLSIRVLLLLVAEFV